MKTVKVSKAPLPLLVRCVQGFFFSVTFESCYRLERTHGFMSEKKKKNWFGSPLLEKSLSCKQHKQRSPNGGMFLEREKCFCSAPLASTLVYF